MSSIFAEVLIFFSLIRNHVKSHPTSILISCHLSYEGKLRENGSDNVRGVNIREAG